MNVRGDFLKSPYSTNTTALICKSRKYEEDELAAKLSCSSLLSMEFFLLINITGPTVALWAYLSLKNKQLNFLIFLYL